MILCERRSSPQHSPSKKQAIIIINILVSIAKGSGKRWMVTCSRLLTIKVIMQIKIELKAIIFAVRKVDLTSLSMSFVLF